MRSDPLKRREFLALLGGACAWSSGANAQERGVPVIGFLSPGGPGPSKPLVAAFHEALSKIGYVEGRNVAVEYRWAEGHAERLPEMAADLVRRRVSLIATGGLYTARAAQAATSTIPILFIGGPDPVEDRLVRSLNRPGGNLTGVALRTSDLMPKRLQLLNELVPKTRTIALLVNPAGFAADVEAKYMKEATATTNQRLVVLRVEDAAEFETTFKSAVKQQVNGLLVSANPFFTSSRNRLVALAAQYAIPAAYPWREYVDAGGLISYGPIITDAYRVIGGYAGRILKGDSPSNLPVEIPSKFETAVNLKTAKDLGLDVSRVMKVRAEHVVE